MSGTGPIQTVEITPSEDVFERAKRLYRNTDPQVGREEFMKRVIRASVEVKIDLGDCPGKLQSRCADSQPRWGERSLSGD